MKIMNTFFKPEWFPDIFKKVKDFYQSFLMGFKFDISKCISLQYNGTILLLRNTF